MNDRRIGTHMCAATVCRVMVPDAHLMCRTDWAKVPADIQSRVYTTYRARNRNDVQMQAYWDAVTAAVEAVRAHG